MRLAPVRPDVADLVFQVYDRSVHPELFAVVAERAFEFERFAAAVRLCEAGHVVEFRCGGRTATEIAGSGRQPLPTQMRVVGRRLQGTRDERRQLGAGIRYQSSFLLEQLDPEVFVRFNEELLVDCQRADVSFRFPGGHRLAPGALSLVRTEATRDSLLVHAFHTFPDQCAVVKTQSLFEV